jgi:hypothetical protein
MVAPLIIAALTPFVKDLFANGLSLLGNAILSKGKEKVEETLGVKLPEEGKPLTTAELKQMRELEFTHEEKLLELGIKKQELELEGERVAQDNVTKRWEADMLSDSWLSKNIRPLALLHTLLVFDLLLISALFDKKIPDGYLALLGSLLTTMIAAYFVGRTVEKGIDLYQGWKQTKGD